MDRRIAARRHVVREAGARRRLRWLLAVLVLAGAAAFVTWLLFQSSILAVRDVVISGADQAPVAEIIAQHGVEAGIPTVSVDAAALEAELLAHPWVADARVRVTWPGTVEASVVEHRPVGWVGSPDGWLLVSGTGAVLDRAAAVPEGAPTVAIVSLAGDVGDTLQEPATLAALDFVSRLPADVILGVAVVGAPDRLEAIVGGHRVDLGHPSRMDEKAAALLVVLEAGLADGAAVSVVSPTRPAIINPQAVVEGLGGAASLGDDAG